MEEMAEAQANSKAVCEYLYRAAEEYDWETKKFERWEFKKWKKENRGIEGKETTNRWIFTGAVINFLN